MRYDLIIFGAGMAGFHCAIAASRLKKKVLLIEQCGSVGGMATTGLVNPFMRYWLNDSFLVEGIFSEVLKRTAAIGGMQQNTFDSELLKITMHEMISEEKNLCVLYNTLPVDVIKVEQRIEKVICKSAFGETFSFEADYFVDTTGNASIAFMSGAETFSGDKNNENQALTTMFVMSGVNFEKIKADVKENRENFLGWVKTEMKLISNAGYFKEIEKAESDGMSFPNSLFFFVQLPGEGRVSVNTTHVYTRATDSFEVSSAVDMGINQVYRVFEFAVKYCSGFENARIEKIAPQIGIRENRRIKGEYIFTGNDVQQMKKFDTGVVKACYGVDVHKKDAKKAKIDKNSFPQYNDYYEIPLNSMISSDVENLYMAGRCFSSDFIGHSAARIMPTCAGMGQTLGVFLGLYDGDLNQFNKNELLTTLEKIAH